MNIRLQFVGIFVLLSLLIPVFNANLAAAADCQGIETAIVDCQGTLTNNDEDNAVLALLVLALQIMAAGVGIVAVGGLIYGGVMYASAGDSPDKVKKAIEIIRNVVIGVVSFLLMFSLLNFLIPGGVLR